MVAIRGAPGTCFALALGVFLVACGDGAHDNPCYYRAVSASGLTTAGLETDGSIWVWGGPPRSHLDPITYSRFRDSQAGAASVGNTGIMNRNETLCVDRPDGGIHCFASVPVDLPPSTRVLAQGRDPGVFDSFVSEWNCSVNAEGAVSCWRNDQSQPPPVAVDVPGSDVIDLALGKSLPSSADGCAIRSDHSLWCWGYGILGDGSPYDADNARPPTEITSLRGLATKVVLGESRKCALTIDQTLYCWGDTVYDGMTASAPPELEPVAVTALGHEVADVDMGTGHACALMLDGRLFCFGDNWLGQVTGDDYGLGRTRDYVTPREITALGKDVAEVTTGYLHTCARKTDDSVWCWGNNSTGQIGHPPVGQFQDFDPVPRPVVGCPAR